MKEGWKKMKSYRLYRCGFSFVCFEVKFVFRKVQVVDEIKLYIGNNKYINVSRLWMYNLIYVFSFIVIYLQIGFVKL